MTASVLRGLVEKALSDLLAFFRINVAGNGNNAAVVPPSRPLPREFNVAAEGSDDTAAVEPSNRSLLGECCQGDKDDEREHPSRNCSGGGGGSFGESSNTGIEVEQQAKELHPHEQEACAAGPLVFKVIFVAVKQGESGVHPPRVFLCGCQCCG